MALSPEAEKIRAELKDEITKFHEQSGGQIEAIGLLFSEMARQPIPPQVICQLLGMDEASVKQAFEAGNPPSATLEQLNDAVMKCVDPGDTVDMYKPIFERHIMRFENQKKVMKELGGALSEFHGKIGGDVSKIEKFFSDLAPEPQRGQPMPEGMINALLRISPDEKKCQMEDFLGCFERNLDLSDTVEIIQPVLKKHLSA
mmetsp:Transcript_30372/g.47580  ORF Transcript_30372/g.47580 Transcript_30372/m.47580 type:complete len:201 (+) Transcript_30372:110-712(+)|eukprot:CAMPEP_0184295062 /NCGR_PEP_ID=MMETSP1049-20130417/6052_1 /TAXON_ID=77928 /ORGANISM="Proteomonas sulcata, Strain CCMP704" /LENGTH=200 /DNA_ID=CAMNT_0026603499 /DNA_START=105 /DNA_END=707 /DNA_ORIENTATION=+